jgi:hypothetical protein
MFCDLVDSSRIVARLDAEEWRDGVGAYLDVASAAVTEMGGKVVGRPQQPSSASICNRNLVSSGARLYASSRSAKAFASDVAAAIR